MQKVYVIMCYFLQKSERRVGLHHHIHMSHQRLDVAELEETYDGEIALRTLVYDFWSQTVGVLMRKTEQSTHQKV